MGPYELKTAFRWSLSHQEFFCCCYRTFSEKEVLKLHFIKTIQNEKKIYMDQKLKKNVEIRVFYRHFRDCDREDDSFLPIFVVIANSQTVLEIWLRASTTGITTTWFYNTCTPMSCNEMVIARCLSALCLHIYIIRKENGNHKSPARLRFWNVHASRFKINDRLMQ